MTATASHPSPIALHPPPELAPALAEILDCGPGSSAAWAMVADMLEESGRRWASDCPELSAFLSSIAYQGGPPLNWSDISLPGGIIIRSVLTDASCTLAEWLQYGPSLARWHPLLRVTLTGREPRFIHFSPERDGHCAWFASVFGHKTVVRDPEDIPSSIFALLEGGETRNSDWKTYANEADALAALSRAAILWSRSQP